MELQKQKSELSSRLKPLPSLTTTSVAETLDSPVVAAVDKIEVKDYIQRELAKVCLSHNITPTADQVTIWTDDIFVTCKYDPVQFVYKCLEEYRMTEQSYGGFSVPKFMMICNSKRELLAIERERRHHNQKRSMESDLEIEGVIREYERLKAEAKQPKVDRSADHRENVKKQAAKYLKK